MLRSFVFYSVLCLALAGCYSTSSVPASGEVTLLKPDYAAEYYGLRYACEGEQIQIRYALEGVKTATLSASPENALSPALPATQVSGGGVLTFEVKDSAIITLMYEGNRSYDDGTDEAELELIPFDLCTGFPINLFTEFTGTLRQETPAAQRLERQLSFEFSRRGFGAILRNGQGYALWLECTTDLRNNAVSCSDDTFSLDATVNSEGLTGRYEGQSQGAVSTGSFSGTLDFEVAP